MQCGNLEYFMRIIRLICFIWRKYSLLLQWHFIFLQDCSLDEEWVLLVSGSKGLNCRTIFFVLLLTFNLFVILHVVVQTQCRSNKHFMKNLESNPLRVSHKASTIFVVFPYVTSREKWASTDLVIWQFGCIPPEMGHHIFGERFCQPRLEASG